MKWKDRFKLNNNKIKCSNKGCNNFVEVAGYCKECREVYNKMYYNKTLSHVGYYLYVVLNNENKVEYVGATENLKQRIEYRHIKGLSHINELMLSKDWDCIKYLDITDLIENREELLMLENALIDLYEPKWNNQKNIIRNVDKLREFSLLSAVHSLTQKWQVYCTREEIRAEKDAKKMLL